MNNNNDNECLFPFFTLLLSLLPVGQKLQGLQQSREQSRAESRAHQDRKKNIYVGGS